MKYLGFDVYYFVIVILEDTASQKLRAFENSKEPRANENFQPLPPNEDLRLNHGSYHSTSNKDW